jgi:hypothetical protein
MKARQHVLHVEYSYHSATAAVFVVHAELPGGALADRVLRSSNTQIAYQRIAACKINITSMNRYWYQISYQVRQVNEGVERFCAAQCSNSARWL